MLVSEKRPLPPYEYFDHTADIGMRAYGADLSELFTNSAAGMFGLVTAVAQIEAKDALEVTLQAEGAEELLWNWLRELLFLFSTQKIVFRAFEYQAISEKSVWATCWGGYFDPAKHESEREIKAVTRHGFKVEKGKTGWRAEVIFDI